VLPPIVARRRAFAPIAEKFEIVSRLAGLRPAVEDVEIHAPGLGDVYAHYSAQDGPR